MKWSEEEDDAVNADGDREAKRAATRLQAVLAREVGEGLLSAGI